MVERIIFACVFSQDLGVACQPVGLSAVCAVPSYPSMFVLSQANAPNSCHQAQ